MDETEGTRLDAVCLTRFDCGLQQDYLDFRYRVTNIQIDSVLDLGEETGLEGEDTTKPQSCAGCSRPIRGRYVYKVLEKTWHAGCVCCHDCRLPLSEKCYCRDELLFCKDHFYRSDTRCRSCMALATANLYERDNSHSDCAYVTCEPNRDAHPF